MIHQIWTQGSFIKILVTICSALSTIVVVRTWGFGGRGRCHGGGSSVTTSGLWPHRWWRGGLSILPYWELIILKGIVRVEAASCTNIFKGRWLSYTMWFRSTLTTTTVAAMMTSRTSTMMMAFVMAFTSGRVQVQQSRFGQPSILLKRINAQPGHFVEDFKFIKTWPLMKVRNLKAKASSTSSSSSSRSSSSSFL